MDQWSSDFRAQDFQFRDYMPKTSRLIHWSAQPFLSSEVDKMRASNSEVNY